MSYGVGVDLGTTFTAAAVRRTDGHVEMITLGRGRFAVPSAVFALPDGEVIVGDVAMDRGREEPGRLAVEFKRRLGDSTPILLSGAAYSADRLTAELLRWTLSAVAERQGSEAEDVVVTHPANWGEFRRDMMHGALQLAGVGDAATLITEPEAAALHYASRERVEPGELVAVYDLGGGTFDAVVLERTADGFTTRGRPRGIERLGGVDLDHIIRGMVTEHLATDLSTLDPSDPSVAADLYDLHSQCIQAKVALSSDLATTVRVRLADERADIRLTRSEFEERARPTLAASVEALESTITGAGVTAADVAKILLVGGSSRIPLIAEMVFDALGRPVAVDTDPKAAVAMGAALTAEVPGAELAAPTGTGGGAEGDRAEVAPPPSPVEPGTNEPDLSLSSKPPPPPPQPEPPPPPPRTEPPPPPPSSPEPEPDTSTTAPSALVEPDESSFQPPSPPVPDTPVDEDLSEDKTDDRPGVSRRSRLLLSIGAILVAVIVIVVVVVVVSSDDDPDVAEPEEDPEDEPLEFVDLREVENSVFPFETEINGHQFTSISGIAFDPNAGVHLGVRANTNRPDPELIAPEPLLFTIRVTESGDVRLIDAVELTGPDGEPYGLELDAEGLEVLDDGTVVVVSEGHPPDEGGLFVHRHDRDGTFLQSFEVPETYVSSPDGDRGVVNQGFDSVTLVRDRDLLVVGVERPLAQDERRDEGGEDVVRLLGFDSSSGDAVREWGYPLDPVHEDHPDADSLQGSLLALVAVDDRTVLAWERSFAAPGGTDPQHALYQIDLDDGVAPGEELPPVLDKRLVWADVDGELTANFDSVSLGMPGPDGETTLVFAGDCRYRECDTEILTVALAESE